MAFVTVKRKTLIIVLSITLAIVAIVATAATVASASRVDNGLTVVLDAGHGGADGGVVGVKTGTKESDVNLAITKYLMKYLQKSGYNVVLTRSDSGAVCSGMKYDKKEDMKARKTIISDTAPDLVISIHCNSYPIADVNGAQVFYSQGSNSGSEFAEIVQNYFNDVLNSRNKNSMIGDYYVLNCSEYPSILCECGFLSNASDEEKLITANYQEKIAYTIFSAVDSLFNSQKA